MVSSAAVASWLLAAHAAANAVLLRDPPPAPAAEPGRAAGAGRGGTPRVSALVPARDEAARIGGCIAALRRSRGVDFEIVVLDDGSTDGTAAAVAETAEGDPRVRVVAGRELPAGWLGKSHACAQLAEAARGEVLAFVDADVRIAPDGLARSVALLDEGPLDLVCPYPRQVVGGPATRLVQPLLQWSWLTFLPLRLAERSPRPSLVAANGQVLVCGASDYRRAGGHAGVRASVLEDLALARAFKRAGLRAGVVAGETVASCTMYDDWGSLRDGYTKSLWAAFGGAPGGAAAGLLLAWLYLVPPLAVAGGVLRGDAGRVALGLAGTAGGWAGRVVAARRTGGRAGDAVWHPASIGVVLWLLAGSVLGRARGDLVWRGRRLDAATGAG